jgi:hypothetical protein
VSNAIVVRVISVVCGANDCCAVHGLRKVYSSALLLFSHMYDIRVHPTDILFRRIKKRARSHLEGRVRGEVTGLAKGRGKFFLQIKRGSAVQSRYANLKKIKTEEIGRQTTDNRHFHIFSLFFFCFFGTVINILKALCSAV